MTLMLCSMIYCTYNCNEETHMLDTSVVGEVHKEEVGAKAVAHYDEEEGEGVESIKRVQVDAQDGLLPTHQAVISMTSRDALANGSCEPTLKYQQINKHTEK